LYHELSVSIENVKNNFKYSNTSLENVQMIKGFHSETFPKVRSGEIGLKKIAILRCDSDMWSSTMDILYHSWDLIEVGGYIINDDGSLPADKAFREFSKTHGFEFQKTNIDKNSYYFQKTKAMDVKVKYDTYYRNQNTHLNFF